MNLRDSSHEGQIVVLFGLLLVALVAMVGLILDGGSASAQRRDQQNAADLASLAGANTYLLTNDSNATIAAARTVAAANGYSHGSDGVKVDVTIDTTNGASVTAYVEAPHHNNFGAIVGLGSFPVAATATALSGIPDSADGAAPMIFSIDAFNADGTPKAQYANPGSPYAFGDTNNHAPDTPGDFAWTNYGTGNVNTNEVKNIIGGSLVISKTLDFGEYIGQHNNGNHTALFDKNQACEHQPSVNKCLSGKDVPVPIVDHNGYFQGWATFHVTSAEGGSVKKVFGYFKSSFIAQRLTIGGCSVNDCPRFLGSYVLKLID
jgi:Flp pilus assembly protein TadG